MPMLNFMNKILSCFESCFSRKAAFRWFVIITVGLMLRSDKLGVTSVIRDLALKPDCYISILHFFLVSGGDTAVLVSDSPPFPSFISGRWLPYPGGRWGKAVKGRTAHSGSEKALSGIGKLCKASVYPWSYVRWAGYPCRIHS